MTNTKEQSVVWKQYPDYPFVEVNQYGEIRTVDRYVGYKNKGKRLYKGRVLKQQLDRYGYLYVTFSANGKRVHLKSHRAVAICFLPNPKGLPQVNHIDCNPTNNVVSNLEWCTGEYNNSYREKYGKALNCPIFSVNLKTFEILYFKSQREAGRQLGLARRNIERVVKGVRGQTHGFWFCHADENAIEKIRAKFGDEVADEAEKLMNENCN